MSLAVWAVSQHLWLVLIISKGAFKALPRDSGRLWKVRRLDFSSVPRYGVESFFSAWTLPCIVYNGFCNLLLMDLEKEGLTVILIFWESSMHSLSKTLFIADRAMGTLRFSPLWLRLLQSAYCHHGCENGLNLLVSYLAVCFETVLGLLLLWLLEQ